MRRLKAFRTSILTVALAIFAVTAVCPGQCVFAAPAAPAASSTDCHGHEEAPLPDTSTSAPCCPSIVALKASPETTTGLSEAPALLPVAFFEPRALANARPFRSSPESAPPSRALYLRSHALLI